MVKELKRCGWCKGDALYEQYHDEEWGVPTWDSGELMELLILEGMQAGLSWITVLKKREQFRKQLFRFNAKKLAAAKEKDLTRWLGDAGPIRHRGKLEAAIGNARATLELPVTLADFVWDFVDGVPQQNRFRSLKQVPAEKPASQAMAKALKKNGFRFVGPTICYAFMQSAGLVNDHVGQCFRHAECATA